MFDFLKKGISGKSPGWEAGPAPHSLSSATAPGTQLHYDPDLVGRLVDDHRSLLEMHARIAEAYKDNQQHRLHALLEEFDHRLREHLLLESSRLHIYLLHSLQRGTIEWQEMHDYQHEMKKTGQALTRILDRYVKQPWDDKLQRGFGPALVGLGTVLARRIQSQEKLLYPRYMQPPGTP